MKTKLWASLAISAAALMAVPSAANADGTVTITWPSTTSIPDVNDFKTQLNGLGYYNYASTGATMTIDPNSAIDFYFLGSESGYNDTFSVGGTAPFSNTEMDAGFTPWTSVYLGSSSFLAGGSLAGLLNFSADGSNSAPATVGQYGFGIFLPRDISNPGSTTVSQFYLGYDDIPTNSDDNHDDYIVLGVVRSVPEPATWAMMLLGFGGIGLAMRRRRDTGKLAQVA